MLGFHHSYANNLLTLVQIHKRITKCEDVFKELMISHEKFKSVSKEIRLLQETLLNDRFQGDPIKGKMNKEVLVEKLENITKVFVCPVRRVFEQGRIQQVSFKQLRTQKQQLFRFSNNFPDEIWGEILSHLTLNEQARLCQLSKFFKNKIDKQLLPKEGFMLVYQKKGQYIVNLSILYDGKDENDFNLHFLRTKFKSELTENKNSGCALS